LDWFFPIKDFIYDFISESLDSIEFLRVKIIP